MRFLFETKNVADFDLTVFCSEYSECPREKGFTKIHFQKVEIKHYCCGLFKYLTGDSRLNPSLKLA